MARNSNMISTGFSRAVKVSYGTRTTFCNGLSHGDYVLQSRYEQFIDLSLVRVKED